MKMFLRPISFVSFFVCVFLSGISNAVTTSPPTNTISTTTTVPAFVGDSNFHSEPVLGLSKFDPDLGTLTGVELQINNSYNVASRLLFDTIDSELAYEIEAVIDFQISLSIPYSGGSGGLFATGVNGDSFGCFVDSEPNPEIIPGPEDVICFDAESSATYSETEDVTSKLIDNDALPMFIGSGELDFLTLEFLHFSNIQLEIVSSENVDLATVFPEFDFDMGPADVTVIYTYEPAVTSCGGIYNLPPNQWRQISLPCDPNGANSVTDIIGDDISGTYDTQWVIYRFNPLSNSYEKLSLADPLEQGVGYWIIQHNDSAQNIDMPASSSPTEIEPFPIFLSTKPMDKQWNMIGYPYTIDIPLSDVQIFAISGGCLDGCTLDIAESDNLVQDILYTYNGIIYDEISSSSGDFNPWKGYWARTLESADGTGAHFLFSRD
ncbi:MAG: choice-of-anchor E domain-containing protein [Methylococcaceae bacterium]